MITDNERKSILLFLQWNDKNGCYTDEECKQQGYKPFGKKDTIKLFFSTINKDIIEDPLSYSYPEIISISKETNIYFSTILKLQLLLKAPNCNTYKKIIKYIK